MKMLKYLNAGLIVMVISCQTNSEMSDSEKEIVLKAVKEASQQFWETMIKPYDAETFNDVFEEFSELDFFVDNFQFLRSNSDVEVWFRNLTESRLSTHPTISESYYEVLSNDKVLEVVKGDFTVTRKDSTIFGPIEMIITIIWDQKNGRWKMHYGHQSTRNKQG
jgi:hypothetical protein